MFILRKGNKFLMQVEDLIHNKSNFEFLTPYQAYCIGTYDSKNVKLKKFWLKQNYSNCECISIREFRKIKNQSKIRMNSKV